MQLLTAAIKKRIPALYSTEGRDIKPIIVKFFTPDGDRTWFVVEGKEGENGDWLFYGWVIGQYREWGYFTLHSLQAIRGGLDLPVERDRHFEGSVSYSEGVLV